MFKNLKSSIVNFPRLGLVGLIKQYITPWSIRRPATALLVILNAPWALPCVFILRCLRPWYVVRLGSITCDHIGHFILEVNWLWALRQQQTSKSLDLYWFFQFNSIFNSWVIAKPCNQFYAAMVRRNFLIYPGFLLQPISVWNRIIPGGKVHHVPNSWERIPYPGRPVDGTLAKIQGNMPFLPEEDAQAQAWLRQQGWQDGEPFVCLLVRDSAFKAEKDHQKEYTIRNSDILTYGQAAEWLAAQGVWVLRMGKKMDRPVPTTHPRIVDYAFHPEKSDLLDIWLFAHCDLCITTGSGPDLLSNFYGHPVLLINYVPIVWLLSFSHATCFPKKLLWQSSDTPLNLLECLDYSYRCTEWGSLYAEQGIQVVDLTAEEILAAVQEQWQRLQGTWVDSDLDQDRQYRFLELFKNHPRFYDNHNWIHPEFRVGSTWLRSMGDDFLIPTSGQHNPDQLRGSRDNYHK